MNLSDDTDAAGAAVGAVVVGGGGATDVADTLPGDADAATRLHGAQRNALAWPLYADVAYVPTDLLLHLQPIYVLLLLLARALTG